MSLLYMVHILKAMDTHSRIPNVYTKEQDYERWAAYVNSQPTATLKRIVGYTGSPLVFVNGTFREFLLRKALNKDDYHKKWFDIYYPLSMSSSSRYVIGPEGSSDSEVVDPEASDSSSEIIDPEASDASSEIIDPEASDSEGGAFAIIGGALVAIPKIEKPKMVEKELMKSITDYLIAIEKFPTKNPFTKSDNSRTNIYSDAMKGQNIDAFVLGKVKDYSKSEPVDSAITTKGKFDDLYKLLKQLVKLHNPKFKYTSIQINKSVETDWHFDKGNRGLSYCLALGNFEGGGVVVERGGKEFTYDNHNKWLLYDGHELKHKSAKVKKGDRFAVIFYRKS